MEKQTITSLKGERVAPKGEVWLIDGEAKLEIFAQRDKWTKFYWETGG